MSSDNYMLIRKVGERFGVTTEFVSGEGVVDFHRRARWFDSAEEALRYAISKRTEYGVTFDDGEIGLSL